jgi:stage II sporulation protein R
MKKTLILIAIIIVVMSLSKNDTIIIPKESIRFRVIANSNTKEDQMIKEKVVSKLKKSLSSLTYTPKNINDTRKSIKDNLKIIDETIRQEVKDYSINYGYNYFPEKVYKGIYYEEGEYESLVITLGEGIGNNFWCVLFPPLCLIDEEQDEVEYTTFIKELIDKYF